ncbi:MAG TPA: SBBP repeat-containing protein, partial [Humisphaera sp.]
MSSQWVESAGQWAARVMGLRASSSARRGRAARARTAAEPLESRRLLSASFGLTGSTLTIDLDANESLGVTTDGTNYSFSLASGPWSGTDGGGASGSGTNLLTVAVASVTAVSVNDAGTGTAVAFNDSGANAYAASVTVTLDNAPAAAGVTFNGGSGFSGSNALSVAANAVTVNGTVTTTSGNLALRSTGAVTVAAGATVNSGTGALTLAADVTAADAGDDGTGTLSIGAGAKAYGATIALRGADQEIAATANVGSTGIGTLPTFATGLSTISIAKDASGNVYAPSSGSNTIQRITPAGAATNFFTPSVSVNALAFGPDGSLYAATNTDVLKIASDGSGSTTYATGFVGTTGMAFDSQGNLYVADRSANKVRKVAPGGGAGSVSDFATIALGGFTYFAVAVDASDNVYASVQADGSIRKYTPGGAASTFATGFPNPTGLAFGAGGVLYVANFGSTALNAVSPAGVVSTVATLPSTGNAGLAYDAARGLLYVGNQNQIVKFVPATAAATTQLTVRSSLASRPMSLGGTNTAVAGINLTDAELARLTTAPTGTVTFGDATQTGDVTVTTATPATTAAAATAVVQSTAGAGKIVLDDGAGTATALNGNGGAIALTAGTGGVVATAASNTAAELSTTAATVSVVTAGPVGTSANRIQFATNSNTAQQVVSVGTTGTGAVQPSGVFLDGLGDLTLGNVYGGTTNAAVDVAARGNLTVSANATVDSGTAANSLAADVTAVGAGDNGSGTLTVAAGAVVRGATITPRGADVEIASTATIGGAGLGTFASGFGSTQYLTVHPTTGDLYVSDISSNTVKKVTSDGNVTTFASGISAPIGLDFDAAGNLYVATQGGGVTKITPGGAASSFATGTNGYALAVDPSGNVYVGGNGAGSLFKIDPQGNKTTYATASDLLNSSIAGLAADGNGNVYVSLREGKQVLKFTAPSTSTLFRSTGGFEARGLALDAAGNLILGVGDGHVERITPAGAATTIATGVGGMFGIDVDASGAIYLGNYQSSVVNRYVAGTPTSAVAVRSSVASRPMSLGGTNTAVAGINLTDAELARIFTNGAGSTVTFGDTAQTGDVTVTTATLSTSAGATTQVVQSTAGTGKITLDDGSAAGTALNGNGGSIALTAGTGGIRAASANNTAAEVATTGAAVTLNTTGTIGTATNRIQLADNTNTAQQVVSAGSTAQASALYLGGLGSMTLGSVSGATANTTVDVTALTHLAVATNAAVNAGTGSVTLAADKIDASAAASVFTLGFTNLGTGANVNEFYNGGTDSLGNAGPNLGVSFASGFDRGNGVSNFLANVPAGFTTGFAIDFANVAIGYRITITDGLNGSGNVLFTQDYFLAGDGTQGVTFAGTAKSVTVAHFSGTPTFDNATFGSSTVGTPVNETLISDGVGTLTVNAGASVLGGAVTLRGADADVASTASVGNTSTTAVTVGSTVASRPMSLGGTNTAVTGINLTDAELARIVTSATGTVTFGESTQTGNVTVTTATLATTAGAKTQVIQSTTGAGKITLDDGGGTATALNGNGGAIALTAGLGGVAAAAASNAAAEVATTGATVSVVTAGPVGTAANRIQFATNANTAQQVVTVGTTGTGAVQPTGVFLDGLGDLTVGNVFGGTTNATVDVTARGNLAVAGGATVDAGTAAVSLGADLTAAGAGDNGVGTLSIGAAAGVYGATINLRAADADVASTANVGTAAGASIAYAGSDLTTRGAWRTAGTAKALDPDGNNVYGSAGYSLPSSSDGTDLTANPSFATIARASTSAFYGGGSTSPRYISVDNPTGAGTKTTGLWYTTAAAAGQENDFARITMTAAGSFRVGVLINNADFSDLAPDNLRVRQTVGGTADSGLVNS